MTQQPPPPDTPDDSAREEDASTRQPLEHALRERMRSEESAGARRTWAGLLREFASLPGESLKAGSEIYAALVGVSLRTGVEFLQTFPAAARVLDADELRAWGELGRKLAAGDAESGARFFREGAAALAQVPRAARLPLLSVCARQLTLSSAIALETYEGAPLVAGAIGDEEVLCDVYAVALEIARRSARHSADFLAATPTVASAVARLPVAEERGGDDDSGDPAESQATNAPAQLLHACVRVAEQFALRAGGIAADMWKTMPAALNKLPARDALALLAHAEGLLERGGAAALHALAAGGEALRLLPETFDEWERLLHTIAAQGNAGMVALARVGPQVFHLLAPSPTAQHHERIRAAEVARRVMRAAREVAELDGEAAISCFRSAPAALRAHTVEQFEAWARGGLEIKVGAADARARRSYYALETRRSNDALRGAATDGKTFGLALEDVSQTLRLYVEALTNRAVEIAPLAAVPDESRIGDGRTIHLPANVGEFGTDALNFRLYKVLAAHAAGQIEFGTRARDTADLRAAYDSLAELYAPENLDALDAFALDGYINDPAQSEPALPPEEEARRQEASRRRLPEDSDYRAVVNLFPQAGLAARIFGTLENGRIDRRLRHAYRGLARDLDLVREHLRKSRPRVGAIPPALVPFELLFQITLCGGALEDARGAYGQVVSELESVVVDYLTSPDATVADTLMATSRVYSLFQSVVPDMTERDAEQQEQQEGSDDNSSQAEDAQVDDNDAPREKRDLEPRRKQRQRDARELFNAWAQAESSETEAEVLEGAERWAQGESPEHELEEGEVAFAYDEWDRELNDTRVGWCRVIEKSVRAGDPAFVEQTRARYRGVISSVRHQFQLMRPESLKRVPNELDGEDYDLGAVIDYVADRRAARQLGVDAGHSERLYVKRLRRERDVAVAFLLDQSSSTARTIGRHPLQPYTHPGRRIIEIEKEGLVLMSEALDAVGDPYAIYGFTSEGRRNVKFYVVKDFAEPHTEDIEHRIGGINYQHNTRLGAAVRHAAARLRRQDARTRLLIILSDGRPYDHDYGDARYAREDTREALRQARRDGLTPFCVTIDRDSEVELKDLYGDVGYTIIDDVLNLPERMPAIYRRLTT